MKLILLTVFLALLSSHLVASQGWGFGSSSKSPSKEPKGQVTIPPATELPVQVAPAELRPFSIDELMSSTTQDLRRFSHETHLRNLNIQQVNEYSKRLLDYTHKLLDRRDKAQNKLEDYGGTAGVFLSGEGKAHKYHLEFAAAQKELLSLSGPMEALLHAGIKVGSELVPDEVARVTPRLPVRNRVRDTGNNPPGRQIFLEVTGYPSHYTRKTNS